MDRIEIDDQLLAALHLQAAASERKRMNYDLRTTAEDGSQRMLNALEVGTKVPIHRHLETSETTELRGKAGYQQLVWLIERKSVILQSFFTQWI